ncbi:MAG: hypothetical protein ACI9FR_002303 [Cryomorphaceae bacterium]
MTRDRFYRWGVGVSTNPLFVLETIGILTFSLSIDSPKEARIMSMVNPGLKMLSLMASLSPDKVQPQLRKLQQK